MINKETLEEMMKKRQAETEAGIPAGQTRGISA